MSACLKKRRKNSINCFLATNEKSILPSGEKPSAGLLKSDVDELPDIRAKLNKNAYAIVIGIEQYRQKLPKADFATRDAKKITEYLTKAMGYPEENVITLLNDHASNVDFVKYFEKWLPNNVEKDGTVFVYYSGHGAPDTKTGCAYLVPYDGDPAFIAETGYSLKRMYDALGKLPAPKNYCCSGFLLFRRGRAVRDCQRNEASGHECSGQYGSFPEYNSSFRIVQRPDQFDL